MANKNIDITKTGPATYRQLQQANASPYQDDVNTLISTLNSKYKTQVDPYRDINQPVATPLLQQGDRWGNSMWDNPTATVNDFEGNNLNDIRGENQWAIAKLGAGIAKGATLAATTFLNGTIGLLTGIGTAIYEDRFSGLWDNEVSRVMDEINKWSEKALPNYYTEEEQIKPWYENIFTANFWGDKFIKNLGFTVGAFYSGGVYSKGLTGLMKLLNAGQKVTSVTTSLVGSAISAVNEGSIEALNAANDYKSKMTPMIDAQYNEIVSRASDEYNITGDVDAYNAAVKDAMNKRDLALAKLNEDAAKVGNTTLSLNIPILTASNYIQFARLYAGGNMFDRRKVVNSMFSGIGKNSAGKYVAKGNVGTNVATILKSGIVEGSEEFAQRVASETSQNYYAKDFNNYYRALNGIQGKEEVLDWSKTFGETLSRNLSDNSTGGAWEEFAIGALTGLLGMPKFRGIRNEQGKLQSPVVLEENMFQKWKNLRKEKQRNTTIANYLNNRIENPNFKNYYQRLARHFYYEKMIDDAAGRNDKFDYKNAEHAQLISDIEMFYNAGRLDDLKALAGEAFDSSDSNIEAIIEGLKTQEGYSPYIDDKGNIKSKEEIARTINRQRKNVSKMIDEYIDTKQYIDRVTAQALDEESLNELTWMKTQLNNWEERGEKMADSLTFTLKTVKDRIQSLKESADIRLSAIEDINSEEYKETKEEINNYNAFIENLSKLLRLNTQGLATTLSSTKNAKASKDLISVINAMEENILEQDIKLEATEYLNDLQKLGEASEIYSKKFAEYLINPSTQAEDHAKVDSENTENALNEERKGRAKLANNASTFGELNSLLEEGKIDETDLNNANTSTTAEFEKAKLFRRKALELIASSDSEFKEALADLIESKFNEAASYDDLISGALIVLDEPQSVLLLGEIEKETLYNEFSHLLQNAANKANEGNSQKEDTDANPKGEQKNTGNDSTERIEEEPQNLTDIANEVKEAIIRSNLPEELKTEAKNLVDRIVVLIPIVKANKEDEEARLALRNAVSELKEIFNSNIINILTNIAVKALERPAVTFSTKEDIIQEEEKQYEPTSVTGVLKTVIPQFDLDAKRDGILIDFVGDERNQGYSYVYNKLKEVNPETGKNAFDYVNEGNVKEGDNVEVRYEEATDEHPELLALYHNGTLINYLNTDESITGVKEIKEQAKDAKEGKNPHPTVRVSKVMDGQYGYDRTKMQDVGELLGTDDAKIGVVTDRQVRSNTKEKIESVFDIRNSKGKVYILLPNSKGTLTPKQLYVKHFNRDEFRLDLDKNQKTPIGEELRRIIGNLATQHTQKAAQDAFIELSKVLYLGDDFHLNIEESDTTSTLVISYLNSAGEKTTKRLLLSKQASNAIISVGEEENTESFAESIQNIEGFIVNTLYEANLPFNISAKRLETEEGYANMLRDSGVLGTYLTGKRMQGTWLLFNEEKPKDNSRSNDAYAEKKRKEDEKESGISITLDGKQYYVKGNDIYYNGSIIDLGDKTQEALDLAFIESTYGDKIFGVNQHNGVVLIEDAKGKRAYDRKNKRYYKDVAKLESILRDRQSKAEQTAKAVTNILNDQKQVILNSEGNPDTSTNDEGESVYHIKEEDGNVHEYNRVHSIIGSNYIGPTSGTSATSRGQIVDSFAREYLNALKEGKEATISKPEGLSDKSYNTLVKALTKFYNDATKRGLTLVTDRIVVFNKLEDGRRIAGELDVFAYNPTTGDIFIFDFKTSKFSTKDKSYNQVTNPNLYTRSNKEQHTLQLSAYAKIIEDKYGVNVTGLIIVPYRLVYGNNNSIDAIFPESLIGLQKNGNIFNSNIPNSNQVDIQWYSTAQDIYHTTKGIPVEFEGQTYYIITYNNAPALVAPNGVVVTINMDLGEAGDPAAVVQTWLNSHKNEDNFRQLLSLSPLTRSPHGNNIVLTSKSKASKLNDMEAPNNAEGQETKIEEEANKKEEKPVVSSEEANIADNEKSWDELDDVTQLLIMESNGFEKEDAKDVWDNSPKEVRDNLLGCI